MTPFVLYVNAVGAVMGGAARHLQPFLEAVAAQRPDWRLVVWVSHDDVARPVGGQVTVRKVSPSGARRVAWDGVVVGRRAARGGASVLLNLTNHGPFRSPVPSVLYQRNPIYFDPAWVRRLGQRARSEAALRRRMAFAQMRAATIVVTPSHAMAGYLRSWRAFSDATPVRVVPHGVDLNRFAPEAGTVPGAAAQPRDGRIRLLSVSHGAPHKGQELLVDLVHELGRRGVDAEVRATIAVADAPAYVEGLVTRAAARGVAGLVHLLGRVPDVERLYGQSDVFVFPSLTESFGFPLIEAMASGVPVVASAIPSTLELLADAGWYFGPGDAAGAADQVAECLALPDADRAARVTHARELGARLTWERNAASLVTVVEEAAGMAPLSGGVGHRRRPRARSSRGPESVSSPEAPAG